MSTSLRGARSTPYIDSPSSERRHARSSAETIVLAAFSSVENLALRLNSVPARIIAKGSLPPVQLKFNTGSSSSTDLSCLYSSLYNNSDDPEVLAQWMGLYEAQKKASMAAGAGVAESAGEQTEVNIPDLPQIGHYMNSVSPLHADALNHSRPHENSASEVYSDSAEDLLHNRHPHCSRTSPRDSLTPETNTTTHKYSINRSMDVLPTKEVYPRILEKCCSVELGGKATGPPSKLVRSKEMPNILDIMEDSD